MSLFGRIKNIIRSNINSKGGNYGFEGLSSSDFYQNSAEDSNFRHEENDKNPENNEKAETQTLEEEYYANLELPPGADFKEIKASYKRLLKKYHPDKFNNDPKKLETAQRVIKKLNEAYQYFGKKYD